MQVIDTPDPVNSNLTPEQLNTEIKKWKRLTSPGPSAILLTVRCDVRYTAEEYDIYKKIKAAWADDSFKHVLVVAFTFGDRQDTDLDEELKTVCPELKNVLKDSGGRYALFNALVRMLVNYGFIQSPACILNKNKLIRMLLNCRKKVFNSYIYWD